MAIRFELNPLMIAGMAVSLIGGGAWAAGEAGAWDPHGPLQKGAFVVVIAGATLYLVGRIVQLVGKLRKPA